MSFLIIVVLLILIFLLYKLWKSTKKSDEEYIKRINKLKEKEDDYISILGYAPSNMNNKGTFVWDHPDECMRKNVDNFIWSNHVFGSYVNSFNSDEDFTLVRMPKCITYIKKKEFENPEEYDDKARQLLGFKTSSEFDNTGLDDEDNLENKTEKITDTPQSEN